MNRTLIPGVSSLTRKIYKNGSWPRASAPFIAIRRNTIVHTVDNNVHKIAVATLLTRQKQIDLIIREGLKRNPPAKQGNPLLLQIIIW